MPDLIFPEHDWSRALIGDIVAGSSGFVDSARLFVGFFNGVKKYGDSSCCIAYYPVARMCLAAHSQRGDRSGFTIPLYSMRVNDSPGQLKIVVRGGVAVAIGYQGADEELRAHPMDRNTPEWILGICQSHRARIGVEGELIDAAPHLTLVQPGIYRLDEKLRTQ